jgi:hypothetical protein
MKNANKPVILLRAAAVLMFVHFAGHTIGMLQGPSHGPEEVVVIEAMKTHHFDVMGSSRSYWDFFLGFGFGASIDMLLQTVLLWLLSSLARKDAASARPFIAVFVLVWIANVALCARYFFIAPLAFAILMELILIAAWMCTRQTRKALS